MKVDWKVAYWRRYDYAPNQVVVDQQYDSSESMKYLK